MPEGGEAHGGNASGDEAGGDDGVELADRGASLRDALAEALAGRGAGALEDAAVGDAVLLGGEVTEGTSAVNDDDVRVTLLALLGDDANARVQDLIVDRLQLILLRDGSPAKLDDDVHLPVEVPRTLVGI